MSGANWEGWKFRYGGEEGFHPPLRPPAHLNCRCEIVPIDPARERDAGAGWAYMDMLLGMGAERELLEKQRRRILQLEAVANAIARNQ